MKTLTPFSKQRRSTLAATALMAILPQAKSQAQSYPNKPIKFYVPYSAGTATDVIARIFTQKLGEVLGQNFIVENKQVLVETFLQKALLDLHLTATR